MIDLRFDTLPNTLVVDGEDYEIRTDFRVWLQYQELRNDGKVTTAIFASEVPPSELTAEWVAAADEFLASKNETPHGGHRAQVETLDLIRDGDYIVAAFQQAYGIDLSSPCSMHWHRFLALIRGLPQNTKLAEIMGYRSWTKAESERKFEARMKDLRERWTLPKKQSADVLKWQQEAFGAAVAAFAKETESPE